MQQYPAVGKYFLHGFVLICVIILADQYTKWWVIDHMLRLTPSGGGFFDWLVTSKKIEFFINEREVFKTAVLAPFLNFVMVWNQGISFGMFDTNSSGMSLALIALSLTLSLLMLIWIFMATQKRLALPLGMIIGGALANVLDRIRFGAVADFIDVHVGPYHWPAFNLADSGITAGAAILILGTFIGDRGKNGKI